jgi:hypothetical protein
MVNVGLSIVTRSRGTYRERSRCAIYHTCACRRPPGFFAVLSVQSFERYVRAGPFDEGGGERESDTGPIVGMATQMIAKASTWNDPASMKTMP